MNIQQNIPVKLNRKHGVFTKHLTSISHNFVEPNQLRTNLHNSKYFSLSLRTKGTRYLNLRSKSLPN